MIACDAVFAAGVHQDGGADDIGVKEDLGILNGTVHMALSGEVYNHIRMFLLKKPVDGFPVCDALFYKTEVLVVHNRLQRGQVSRIGQAVQTDDPVIGIFF